MEDYWEFARVLNCLAEEVVDEAVQNRLRTLAEDYQTRADQLESELIGDCA
jgi:hypothetical protein